MAILQGNLPTTPTPPPPPPPHTLPKTQETDSLDAYVLTNSIFN